MYIYVYAAGMPLLFFLVASAACQPRVCYYRALTYRIELLEMLPRAVRPIQLKGTTTRSSKSAHKKATIGLLAVATPPAGAFPPGSTSSPDEFSFTTPYVAPNFPLPPQKMYGERRRVTLYCC